MAAKGLTPWAEREAQLGERRMPGGKGKWQREYPRRGERVFGEMETLPGRGQCGGARKCQEVPREIRREEKERKW